MAKATKEFGPQKVKFLNETFNSYDKNDDGELNELEIVAAFYASKTKQAARRKTIDLIKEHSMDDNDTLGFDEFLVWSWESKVFDDPAWKRPFDEWMKTQSLGKETEEKVAEKKCKRKTPKMTCNYLKKIPTDELDKKSKKQLKCCPTEEKTAVSGGRRKPRRKTRRKSRRRKSRRRKSRRRKSRRKSSRSKKRKN